MRAAPIALVATLGCGGGVVDDHFDVVSGDAVLPVHVRGSLDRGVVVLYESGGPSGPGIAERLVGTIDLELLEAEAAVAFYDRRGVGNAHGSYRAEDLSIHVLLDDLDAVNAVLRERYDPEVVVLVGHSFGGLSSALYVLDGPGRVDGWVAVAPVLVDDEDVELGYRHRFACRVATDRIALGDGDPLWPEIDAWCAANPTVEPESPQHEELWAHLDAIDDRLGNWPTMPPLPLLGTVFGSGYNLVDTQLRDNRVSRPVWASLEGVDVRPDLERVEIPALFVTGEYDELGSTELVGEAVTALPNGAFLEIADGGHYPIHADPEAFTAGVLDVIGAAEARP